MFEMRADILGAVVSGFGRAISEVGAIMLVGGKIKGHTRMMTTSIAMLQSMGDYSQAIAIGIVLLLMSFGINSILYRSQQVN
jgi:tungstate transport system permease protein